MFISAKSLRATLSKCSLLFVGAALIAALAPLLSLYGFAATAVETPTMGPVEWTHGGPYSSANVSTIGPSAASSYAGYTSFGLFDAYGYSTPAFALIKSSGSSTRFHGETDFKYMGDNTPKYWLLPAYVITYDMWGTSYRIDYYFANDEAYGKSEIDVASGSITTGDATVTYTYRLYETSTLNDSNAPFYAWHAFLDGYTANNASTDKFVVPFVAPQIYTSYQDASEAIGELQDKLTNPSPENQSRTDFMQDEADRLDGELNAAVSAATIPDYEFTPSLAEMPYTDTLKEPMDFIQTLPYFGTIAAVAVGFWVVHLLLYGVK